MFAWVEDWLFVMAWTWSDGVFGVRFDGGGRHEEEDGAGGKDPA